MQLLLSNAILRCILLLFRLTVVAPFFTSKTTILSIMFLNALKNNTRPESAYCGPPVCWFVDGSQNVTNIMVSAPTGQKCFIFPMYFNNLHLSLISSILHRSARCMKHMLSRTCRFWVVKNDAKHDTYFQ